MCGIAAVYGRSGAARLVGWMLLAQQHRAQEFAGIVAMNGTVLHREVGEGLAVEAITEEALNRLLFGDAAIGHIRYSTVEDASGLDNIQPVRIPGHDVSLAHNGTLINVDELRASLPADAQLVSSLDSELILQRYLSARGRTPERRLINALVGVRGSYSLLLALPDRIIAARDPSGNRPLSIAKMDGSIFISSETCAINMAQLLIDLHIDDVDYVKDVEPGQLLSVTKKGVKRFWIPNQGIPRAQCVFEHIYFSMPSSVVFGEVVSEQRKRAGRVLAQECPVKNAQVVVGVPESSRDYAEGYAAELQAKTLELPSEIRALLRSHYGRRTFIEPSQHSRILAVLRKFHINPHLVRGKVVVVVDDSIVRLTTMPIIVKMFRLMGAKEVHVRIGSPETKGPCYYGIDTPNRAELAAATMTIAERERRLGVDSLAYISLSGHRSTLPDPGSYCYGCMDDYYPLGVPPSASCL